MVENLATTVQCKKMQSNAFWLRQSKKVIFSEQPEIRIDFIRKRSRVMVDDKLKFHVHAAYATKKENQMLGVIKKRYVTRDANTIKYDCTNPYGVRLFYLGTVLHWGSKASRRCTKARDKTGSTSV